MSVTANLIPPPQHVLFYEVSSRKFYPGIVCDAWQSNDGFLWHIIQVFWREGNLRNGKTVKLCGQSNYIEVIDDALFKELMKYYYK